MSGIEHLDNRCQKRNQALTRRKDDSMHRVRLIWALISISPVFGQTLATPTALSSRAGLWEYQLSSEQARILKQPQVKNIVLDISASVNGGSNSTGTVSAEAMLEFELGQHFKPWSVAFSRSQVRVSDTTVELRQGYGLSEPATFKGQFNRSGSEIDGVLFVGAHSVPVRFARLRDGDSDCRFVGNWENSSDTYGWNALKIRRSVMKNIFATMDHMEGENGAFGSLFEGYIGQVGQIKLNMIISGLGPHTLQGDLDANDTLIVDWRGNGVLTPPQFHRVRSSD